MEAASGTHGTKIELHIFDKNWLPPREPYEELVATEQEWREENENLECAAPLIIEKSESFAAMEENAREFLSRLGFDDLPPIYALREGKQIHELEMDSMPPMLAFVDWLNRYVLVRRDILTDSAADYGQTKATSVLVHELMHTTQDKTTIGAQIRDGEKISEWYRTGFLYEKNGWVKGTFLEEAFATFVGGLYARAQTDPRSGIISFADEPAPSVPDHYDLRGRAEGGFLETTTGIDGYALEMLMWRLEQDDTMGSEEFLTNVLLSRSASTQAVAMRSLIRALDAIEPKLYEKLRNVEYGRENWREIGRYVYNLVTGKEWSIEF
jgi:hypothetical protein